MVAALMVAGLALLVVRVPGVAGQAIATATPMPVPTALQASPATVAGMVPGTTMTPVPGSSETATATPTPSPTASATATPAGTVTLAATTTPTPAGSVTTTPTETSTLTATVTSTVTMTPTPAGSATRTVTPTRLPEVAPGGLVRVRNDAGQGAPFTALVAGYGHTCGLVSGGTAYCWGDNANGQLGDGTTGQQLAPVAVSGGRTFTAVVAGWSHTCGLATGGTAYCWGWNALGQLGDGTSGTSRTAPVDVSGGRTFTALVAGHGHTCGLATGGTAYCWGYNQYGQLGDGTLGSVLFPVAVSGGRTFTALVAGYGHTCGLVSGGTAYCWGSNAQGQLGDGTSGSYIGDSSHDRTAPVAVSGGRTFTALVAGHGHTCGLVSGGTAYCWGDNSYGQLGDGTVGTNRLAPVAVSGGRTFTALVAGNRHTCGLTSGGTAYCWGDNLFGQLGDGTTAQQLAPVAVSGGRTFTALVAGFFHTCGLVSGGTAYCWGDNQFGQLGDGTSGSGTDRTAPVDVSGGRTYTALVAGGQHTCGLVSGGTAYCWGRNSEGQLGDGTSGDVRTAPVAVSGGRTYTALVAGWSHTCGLVSGGTAYCWGDNQFGQLGDGTSGTNRTSPVAVSGGRTFTALVAGGSHTCGLATGGTAYCWGGNSSGQLGDGTTDQSPPYGKEAPVAVSGGRTFTALMAGGAHTCGLVSGGTAYCWGLNTVGQLGDGVVPRLVLVSGIPTPAASAIPTATVTLTATATASRRPVIQVSGVGPSPVAVTVYRGETVEFANGSADMSYELAAVNGSWTTGPIPAKGSRLLQFAVAGTYTYTISGVIGATGTITVLETAVTPLPTATATASSTSSSTATPTPSSTSTVTLTPTIPATLRTRLLRVASVSDQAFTVAWVTDVASSGAVRWWPEGNPTAAVTLTDSRGASTVHVVTVSGLLPSTRYAFDLLADFTTDGNGGAHYVVATGPTLGVTPPDTVAGTVVKSAGGVPGRAVAVLTVDAGDGSSASIVSTADAAGRWQLDLGALRASSRLAVLPYTTLTVLTLEVIAGTDGYARRTLTVAEARAATVATTLATSVTQSLALDAGWSLVALPLAPSTDLTAKGICDGARTTGTNTTGSVREVARWQDGGWQSYLCTPGTGDFVLEPGRGYFVRTVASATIGVTGVPFDGRLLLDLRAGWNLVGLPGTGPRLSATGIVAAVEAASVPPGTNASPAVTELDWWEAGQWVGYIRGLPVNATKVLPDGRGAFLRLTRPSTWLLPGIVGTNRVVEETGPDR